MRSLLTRSIAVATTAGLAAMLALGGASAATAAELPEPEIVTGAPTNLNFPIVYDGSLWIRGGATNVWFASPDGETFTEVAGSPEDVVSPAILDGALYFSTFDDEVWRYTEADGFDLIDSIDTSADLVAFDGRLFTSARPSPADDFLLYVYAPGDAAFTLIPLPAEISFVTELFVFGDALHLLAFSTGNTENLYQLDGADTPIPVDMPAPGGGSGDIRLFNYIATLGDTLYVAINTEDFSTRVLYSYELGGPLVEAPGPFPWSSVGNIVAYNGTLYVVDSDTGLLYQSSGGPFTPVADAPLYFGGSAFVFEGVLLAAGKFDLGSDDDLLFAFDGTSFDETPGVFNPSGFFEFNGDVYFFGELGSAGGDSSLLRFDLTPADAGDPELAATGVNELTVAGGVVGAMLLLAGAVLLAASRRQA